MNIPELTGTELPPAATKRISSGQPSVVKNTDSGGVFCLMGDGSAKFVSENIDHATWIGAGTIRGNETLGDF